MSQAVSSGQESVVEEEHQLRGADGTLLFVRETRPRDQRPWGRLALIHGFAEHSGRYGPTMRWLAARGLAVGALDLRGHGRSEGRRTYVNRFAEYTADAAALIRHLRSEGDEPLALLGHSMGGLVALRALQQERLPRLGAAILTSPFLGLAHRLPGWKLFMGRTLSGWAPWVRLASDFELSCLSRDEAVGRAYAEDPLVVRSGTVRWFTETQRAQDEAFASLDAVDEVLPLLIQHGEADALADPQASRRLAEALTEQRGREAVTWRSWPDMRHELLNEIGQEEVREFLFGWLRERFTPRS